MSKIFLEILNNSIIASYLIIAVIILRLVLKKAPKWSVCLLWVMVAVRLMPIEIESSFSLIPDSNPIKIESDKAIYPLDKSQKDAAYGKCIFANICCCKYVYFDYDFQGKIRFLDMRFRNSESWDIIL